MPPWLRAPEGTLPGVVAVELVLARTECVAVCLPVIRVYSSGFELDLVTLTSDENNDLDPFLLAPHRLALRRTAAQEPAFDMLKFGVQFADGSKATNASGRVPDPATEAAPMPPVLYAQGGGGGTGGWRQTFWIWPLPPPGLLTFVIEWSAAEIPLTRHAIEATSILDAAQRAQVIYSDVELPELSPSLSGASRQPASE